MNDNANEIIERLKTLPLGTKILAAMLLVPAFDLGRYLWTLTERALQ